MVREVATGSSDIFHCFYIGMLSLLPVATRLTLTRNT